MYIHSIHHIVTIIKKITVQLQYIIYWKLNLFYYLQKGTSDESNNMLVDLAFNKLIQGVYQDKVTSEENYLVLSTDKITKSSFTNILEFSLEICIKQAMNMHNAESQTLLAIDMELSINADLTDYYYKDTDTNQVDLSNFKISCDAVEKGLSTLYQ